VATDSGVLDRMIRTSMADGRVLATLRKYAEIARACEAGTHAVVPTALTAENGAKAALIGEFEETTEMRCTECDEDYDCEVCEGSGVMDRVVPVSWRTIKAIHKAMVAHFAAAPQFQEE
jgi:hypothetical protein